MKKTSHLIAIIAIALTMLPAHRFSSHVNAATVPDCGPMDVAFVIDTSTSMGGALTNVKSELSNILQTIEAVSRNNYRLALVEFNTDIQVRELFALNNRAKVEPTFRSLYLYGGGFYEPEPSDEAVNTVVNTLPAEGRSQNIDFSTPFRPEALKLVVLVTDARPGGFNDAYTPGVDDVNADRRATEAGSKRINISSIFVPTNYSPSDHPTVRRIMENYALTTDGVFVETTSDGVGTSSAVLSIINRCGTGLEDDDGDSIPNNVEEFGYDYNGDSVIDIDLPSMGAKKDRKDVFVYVEWLAESEGDNHKPSSKSMDMVKDAFAIGDVPNLDGSYGITLHIIFGKAVEMTQNYRELGSASDNCTYNWNELDNIKNRNGGFPAYMRPLFHYALFAHDLPVFPCIGGRPSGISRNSDDNFRGGASDFIVAIDDWEEELQKNKNIDLVRATTFMHELGHNLGLGHGGLNFDDNGDAIGANHINYKPNHLSVMNYAFGSYGLIKKQWWGGYSADTLDYSRFSSSDIEILQESHLIEKEGIKSLNDQLKDYGTTYYCAGTTDNRTVYDLNNPINWNCDQDEDDEVNGDITNDKQNDILSTGPKPNIRVTSHTRVKKPLRVSVVVWSTIRREPDLH